MAADAGSGPVHDFAAQRAAAPDLRARRDRIDLWLLRYDRVGDEALLARLREMLDADERAQEPRYYFADDRKRYLLTRALVRATLSRYAPLAPTQWRFGANAYGRPHVDPAQQAQLAPGLRFNISHTHGLIALAVTQDREIGVDVEHVSHRAVSLGIAHRFFAADEVAALAQVAAERQQDRFFEYWTFKEAYIKARGMGLSLPLERFSFHYPCERSVRLSAQPDLDADAARWSLWQYRPQPEYLLALCAQREAGTQVRVRELSARLEEQALTLAPTRRSDEG